MTQPVRRIQIIAALSLVTDLGTGQPVEFALRSCALAVVLAEAAGMDRETIRQAGIDETIAANLGQLYERRDGRGLPRGIRGEEIAPA